MRSLVDIEIEGRKYIAPSEIYKEEAMAVKHEPWLDFVYQVILNLKKGAFIDVGANVGQNLFKLLKMDPLRRYIGFEPQLEAVFYLQQFLDLNKLSNHQVFPFALSNQATCVELLLRNAKFNRVDSGVASIVPGFRSDKFYSSSRIVYTVKGDQVLSRLDLDNVGMIKLDVEGAEMEVLESLEKTISAYQPCLHFEVLNHFLIVEGKPLEGSIISFRNNRLAILEKFLDGLGYKIYQVDRCRGHVRPVEKIQPRIVPHHDDSNYFGIPRALIHDFRNQIKSYT